HRSRRKDPAPMTTTQNCAECGTRAEPGQSFCDACGAVLSWTDRESRADRAGGASGSDGSARGAGDAGAATDGGAEEKPVAKSGAGPAGSATSAPVSATAAPGSAPSADAGPGWDASSRPDGGTG